MTLPPFSLLLSDSILGVDFFVEYFRDQLRMFAQFVFYCTDQISKQAADSISDLQYAARLFLWLCSWPRCNFVFLKLFIFHMVAMFPLASPRGNCMIEIVFPSIAYFCIFSPLLFRFCFSSFSTFGETVFAPVSIRIMLSPTLSCPPFTYLASRRICKMC